MADINWLDESEPHNYPGTAGWSSLMAATISAVYSDEDAAIPCKIV